MKKQKLYTLIKIALFLFILNGLVFALLGFEKDQEVAGASPFLEKELDELSTYFSQSEALDTSVSQVPVAWHLDHSLKVINRIHDTLTASNPKDYSINLNPVRIAVFSSGKMPRGRGKAPRSVLPPDTITLSVLEAQLIEAQDQTAQWDTLAKHAHFTHPVFGKLHRQHSKQFIIIHTQHHLAIIRDILQKQP